MNHSTVEILIVNYNSTPYLVNCLRSVFESLQGVKADVIVQDNSTHEETRAIIDAFPLVDFIWNKKNIGFAAGVNKGIGLSRSEYILILNPDTLLLDDFFIPLFHFMETHPDVAVAGPRIHDSDGKIQGSARAFPNALTALYGRSSLLTNYFPGNRISRRNVLTAGNNGTSPLEVDWVSGACMVVRRKAIEDVGLLDERFFMYWEDADWCRRMREKGWKIVYFPQAVIYHHAGRSSESRPFRSIYHFHKSAYRLHEKYTKFPLFLLNPLVLVLLAFRGIIAGVTRMAKKKKSIH